MGKDDDLVKEAMRKQAEARLRKSQGLCPRCGAKRLPMRELCGACTVVVAREEAKR